jgi:hypothetical protein
MEEGKQLNQRRELNVSKIRVQGAMKNHIRTLHELTAHITAEPTERNKH